MWPLEAKMTFCPPVIWSSPFPSIQQKVSCHFAEQIRVGKSWTNQLLLHSFKVLGFGKSAYTLSDIQRL